MKIIFGVGSGPARVSRQALDERGLSESEFEALMAELVLNLLAHPPRRRAAARPPQRSLQARLLRMEVAARANRDVLAATPRAQAEDLWARNYGIADRAAS